MSKPFLLPENFIMMPIPADRFTDVCALLGGAALSGLVAVPAGNAGQSAPVTEGNVSSAPAATVATTPDAMPSAASDQSSTPGAGSGDSGELDAHGWPWSADMHAATKGKTKDGLWRMKVGVTRPDPKPGFPKEENATSEVTGTSSATEAPSATSQPATAPESAPTATSAPAETAPTTNGEEDEFAAFRAAAAASDAGDAAAAASVPARQFSDADLGALCNQAAVKLGDPSPIKEIIARYVPEGQVAHSRNIPTERRDDFAKEVEAKAGIQFAG